MIIGGICCLILLVIMISVYVVNGDGIDDEYCPGVSRFTAWIVTSLLLLFGLALTFGGIEDKYGAPKTTIDTAEYEQLVDDAEHWRDQQELFEQYMDAVISRESEVAE